MIKILKRPSPYGKVAVEIFDGYEILSATGGDSPLPETLWTDALAFVTGNPLPESIRQYLGG